MTHKIPSLALDYPDLPDDLFVVWSHNEFTWPHPARWTAYLTDLRVHVLRRSALFTMHPASAKRFATEHEARAWLEENERLRGFPYVEIQVTTVAELKRRRGFQS